MKSEKGDKQLKLKRPKRLNVAMWKYYVLLAALLILLIEVAVNLVVAVTLEKQTRQSVTEKGRQMIAVITSDGVTGVEIESMFRGFLEDGARSYLFSPSGEILLSSDDGDGGAAIEFSDIDGKIADRAQANPVVYSHKNRMNFISRVQYGGENCLLAVSVSMRQLRSALVILHVYLIISGVVVLALAFAFSYMISQKLTGGIQSITEKAVLLAEGDYGVDFTNADYAEVARLSDSLNYVRDEVKKSGDFQREIIANVSHDLKTPLTMIKAYALMIREISGENPKKRDEHLQVIIDESDRLTGLVNDLLSVSKVSSNMDELNLKVFNLTEFVYGVVAKFNYLQQSQGYNIMVDFDSDLYTRADEEKIGQVIYNLVSNAVNYTGEDKTIYVSLKSSIDGARIRFAVRDTGKGISEEEKKSIWNRYYRSDESHIRAVKGTGLGLNIVKVVLENHKFDFGVDSVKGKGAEFWVDFPSVPADPRT